MGPVSIDVRRFPWVKRLAADYAYAFDGLAPVFSGNPAERLADAKTVAELTGQQAGLFGGPVYTLLKAITALKLAEQVSRDHGVPAVVQSR